MTEPLTDEERAKLLANLREMAVDCESESTYKISECCEAAANEIERLCGVISELRAAEIQDRAKHEREIVMALGGRQHWSVR